MRKLINVCSEEQNQLLNQFCDIIQIDSCNDTHHYKKIAISFFDHWLSKDEAKILLNDIGKIEKEIRQETMYFFNKKLIDNNICFTYRLKGIYKTKPIFKKFTNKDVLYTYVKPNVNLVPSKDLYKLVFPELDALYYEGWDYTNYLYYNNECKLNNFLKLVKECNLHILQ